MRAEIVVLALVVVLLTALVIPAIEKTRSRARNVGSADRMRQIYTRLSVYHDVYRSLPVMGRPGNAKKR